MTNDDLVVPFLNADPTFAFGVEFGMWYRDVQALKDDDFHGQYVRTENEEQMRLACTHNGWEVAEIAPWDDGPPENGWVWLAVRKG